MDNKNNNINDQKPLESVTIGTVKQNKNSFVSILIILVIFIGMIYFLPELNTLYQKYIVGSTEVVSNTPKNEVVEEKTEEQYLLFENTDTQQVEDLSFSNIKMTSSILSFNVLNKGNKEIDLEKSNYYMILYNSQKEVKSFLLEGTISPNSVKSFSFNAEDIVADGFYVSVVNDGDYPIYDVVSDSEGLAYINCKNDNRLLIYTFQENLLIKVQDTVEVSKLESKDYDNEYNSYNLLAQNFSFGKIKGAVASIDVQDDSFTYTLNVDYNELISSLSDNLYFSKNTSTSKIMYIMSAKGYNCY